MKKYENIYEMCLEPRYVEQTRKLYKRVFKDPDEPVLDMERVKRLLQGAMDLHIHPGPDPNVLRPLDEAEIAIQACELGMGAVAYKNGYAPSAYTARLAQKIVDQWAKEHGKEPTRVIGGIALGYPVGGLNAVAVRNALRVGGKIVWTPFVDSAHHLNSTSQLRNYTLYSEVHMNRGTALRRFLLQPIILRSSRKVPSLVRLTYGWQAIIMIYTS